MSSAAAIPERTAEQSGVACDPTLRVARSLAEIEALRETWESWQEYPDSLIDNYLACCEAEAESSRPHVLVLYREGRPDCLLIGKRLERAATSTVAKLLPPAGVLYFVQGGLLGNASAENCRFLIREIIAQLRRGEADVAELCAPRVNSPLYQAALQVPNFFCRDHFSVKITHRYLELPPSFQDFLSGLPAKERQNINYRYKRLLKKFPGGVRIQGLRGEDDVERLIADAEEIAKEGYQRAFGRGFTAGSAAGLRAEARKGSLRAYVLYIEEKPCAFVIASWQKGVLYGTFAGYKPQYGEYSPGRLLLMRCIEDCFAQNGGEKTLMVDPGVGDQPYKRLFTNREREETQLTIHAPTFQGALRNFARTTLFLAAVGVKGTLVKTNLLPLIRRMRRKHAVGRWRQGQALSQNGDMQDQPH